MHVLCVMPNPSIDRTLRVPDFAVGGVWRASEVSAVCGGKGANVARAFRALGGRATCAGLLGGHAGRLAADLAADEGLDGAWTWQRSANAGETRTCVIIVGRAHATVINEPGPAVSAADWARFVADVRGLAETVDAVCICGSLPPGVPDGGFAGLIAAAPAVPVWVDTGAAALATAVAAAPAGIKINADEASALLAMPVGDLDAAMIGATRLQGRGPGSVVITLGAQGAALAGAHGSWRARPPAIEAVSAVGSGDAFLAGLVLALDGDAAAADALRLATAAGAANALQPTARIDPEDVRRLAPSCAVTAGWLEDEPPAGSAGGGAEGGPDRTSGPGELS